MRILGIIPARYHSSRFPGKPLVEIGGKSIIRRVWEQAIQCSLLDHVIVATDDSRIQNEVISFGGFVELTSEKPVNGTERCAEAYSQLKEPFDFVVNIQVDEPFIPVSAIDTLCRSLGPESSISTLATAESNPEKLNDPHVVKVVMNKKNQALYFSRSAIPAVLRATDQHREFLHHLGLYAYPSNLLPILASLTQTPLEVSESLEQLRWLEHGYRVDVYLVEHVGISIDTTQDLKAAEKFLNG